MIFRYLRQSINMGLWYSKDFGFELIAYADADHAGCNDDCKSTSRGIQFLGDKLVSWSSKKQDYTAMSSAEAEYHVEKGTIELYFVGTEYQLADLLTKALLKKVFHMAQHMLPTTQLFPQYKPIGRCNNYMVLHSISYSPEFKIVGLILLDHCLSRALTAIVDVPTVYLQQFWRTVSKVPDTEDTIKFMLDTQQFTYTKDMFRDTLQLPVETPKNPFVTPANIHTIEAFMNRVGYQGVVDKVSAFFTKNLAQPWQTMFKVFNRCLTTRTSGHDQTKINILQLFHDVLNRTHVDYAALLWWDFMNNVFQKKEAIQYPHFIKLIIADLMKKFPNIPKRLKEDYHSIKDDVPLVSVYITGNVLVRGMLIPDAFLTAEIRETHDFKDYETVFMKVDVPMNQPQPIVSTKGTHRITPSAHRSPTISASPPVSKKRKQITRESKPGSHKYNPEVVDDDDDKEREKQDDEMGSLKIRNEETRTTIPTPLSSLRKILSSDKKTSQELMEIVLKTATTKFKYSQVKKRISSKYSHIPGELHRMCRRQGMKRNLQDRADDIALWEALRRKFEKSSTSNTSCREDDFHSHHDEHQDDDAPPEGEKIIKRSKKSKRSKSTREWDAWEEENVIDEDEVIPEDVTLEMITESQNVDKRVPTIFDHARIETTLRDSISNMSINAEEYAYHLEQSTSFMENQIVWESKQQYISRTIPKTFYGPQRNPNEPPRPLYNKDLFFLKYGNTKEKKYIWSLHTIHAEVSRA
ncbi:hypothetical protein Tco_1106280 [Tanacetum coccineum]